MKWNDLTLKERKRIYDSVRSKNPKITYLELKEQFDNIPAYENGISIVNSDIDYVKWKESLPSNLRNESYGYDLYGAYKSGAIPTLYEDGYYHLPSRDPESGKILKYPSHDTFYTAITEDIKQGYYPIRKGNNTYTIPINPKEEYSIYQYEDGKESEKQRRERLWKEYKSSIVKDTTRNVPDFYKRPEVHIQHPKNSSIPDNKLFDILNGVEAFRNELDNKLSQSGEDIKEAAVKTNKEKYEKTKQGLNAAGILAQAGLAFAGSAAGAMGHGNLSNVIGASQAIWDAYELANSVNENDNLGIIQNSIPLTLYGAGITKYVPRVNQIRGIDAVSKVGNASGLVWDWLPNPIIEGFKMKRDRENLIPSYKYGKESDIPSPVDYTFGTKEYFDRQQKISGNIDIKTLEDFLFDPKNSSVVNSMNKNQYLMYRDKNRFIERLNKLIPMELAAPMAINSNKGEE